MERSQFFKLYVVESRAGNITNCAIVWGSFLGFCLGSTNSNSHSFLRVVLENRVELIFDNTTSINAHLE